MSLGFVLAVFQSSVLYSQETPKAVPLPPADAPIAIPVDQRLITLDFNNVDLPIFVKFVSEIIGKNFIIDERVRGKVTIFSPSKISVSEVYDVFLSVLELKGFTAVDSGKMIKVLPASEVPPEKEIFVIFLENANAEEVAKLLTRLATKTATPRAAGRPVVKSKGEFEGTVQIIPDKDINALLITASPRDFEMLKGVIKKLDIRRRQVYVEAVIMEVSQAKLQELGTELGAAAGYQSANEDVTILGGFNADPSDFAGISSNVGFDIGLSTVNIRALLTALRSSSDVNILSTPQILTTNHQKAKIVVAQNVPFVTGTSQSAGAVTQRQIQRQDVGVTLEITPEILEGSRVKMDLRQEISTLEETVQEVLIELGPTTNKREATTTIIVRSGQTVVIGGLMRDDITKVVRKIPLLGDIPLLGWFFKFQSKRHVKSNLLIFITPYIVSEDEDLDLLRERKADHIKQAISEGGLGWLEQRKEVLNSINPPGDTR